MDKNICKKIIENKKQFIPYLFTQKQINVIEKYMNKEILTNTEKVYLYSTIKKKVEALSLVREEFYVNGQIIPERIKEAKQILREINKEKAFISGSFLYKKDYNDIDIYIISKKRKSYYKNKLHFTCITEKDLKNPIFISALKYSIANFSINITPEIKRPELNDLIITYEMAINEVFNKEDLKALRGLIFEYHLHLKKEILDSLTLFKKVEEISLKKDKERIKEINLFAKELFLNLYSKTYSYNYFTSFLKTLKEDLKTEPYKNYFVYIDLFNEVKNECRRAQT
jgi:hypothetical protein